MSTDREIFETVAAPDAATEAGFVAALARRGGPVAGLVDGHGCPAGDRFAVYRNNVAHSLAEALAATFPQTRRLMGADDFRGAAIAYAAAHRPRSPVLLRYGDAFADFLMRPGHLAAHVGECARLEYARVAAFHAADAAALRPERLALAPAALAALTLAPHPAARLVATPGGGHGAWRAGSPCSAAAALVTRPAMEVHVAPLDPAGATFAAALMAGEPLAQAAAVEGLALAETLAALLAAGAFADRP
ncbi:DNA-binding domain-containing protein [Acuticoccus sp. I52.16.1]|uniref:HvfC/BufC N-terminal domain-containing protein n=1 Tax=Acuticoccus sp. I52.16.1 TaxID=2928472 RepID=UPI001FD13140|nr:DNA-binding domain-containing protein [Acuticoccus sp. I52.16.1]UOM34401.1 DNA-binding domain-containing protein [Acuticoccus sp. I52.16.1]